jgi:carboxyl-terminal processing protease
MEAVKKLRGKPGTKVVITVLHQLTGKREKLTITRDIIKVRSVRAAHLADEDAKIGYIRLNNFQRSSADELDQAVKKLTGEGMRALVLDLRRNPGGLLDSAVAVADRFVGKGLIVKTKGRTEGTEHRFDAHKAGTYPDFPLAVLVSGYSASGSEIVAGAVQDHRRGILVGKRTFGKGSVQSILSLEGGSKLRLTTARYYTPNDRMIHRDVNAKEDDTWGIQPDIKVETTYEEELGLSEHFRQERIAESTKNHEPEQPNDPAPKEKNEGEKEGEGEGEKESKKEPFVDRTLVRAVDALKAVLVYRKR